MQKKIILNIIVVNLFIAIMAWVGIDYSNRVSSEFATLNDNQIRVFNYKGFTLEQMKAIDLIDGVSQSIFDNRNIFPYYSIDVNEDMINARGISIEEDNQFQKQLEYIAGSYITDEYQVVITQSLADALIAGQIADDYQQLIDEELVTGLEIVGVTPDLKSTVAYNYTSNITEGDDRDSPYTVRTHTNLSNGFLIFNRGKETEMEQEILNYNDWVHMNSYGTDEEYKYVTARDSEGNSYTDYHASIENGASGLIDPETTEYGDVFNQFAFINVDGDRQQVVSQLQNLLPDAAIVTSDTKLNDFENTKLVWIPFIIVAIILEIFIFYPHFKLKKRG